MKMLFKSLRPVLSAVNTFRDLRRIGESPPNKPKEVEQPSLINASMIGIFSSIIPSLGRSDAILFL